MFNSFNKKETDFENLQEYNNYLEEVESISKYVNTLIMAIWTLNIELSFELYNRSFEN